jgi:hypothetical protein
MLIPPGVNDDLYVLHYAMENDVRRCNPALFPATGQALYRVSRCRETAAVARLVLGPDGTG